MFKTPEFLTSSSVTRLSCLYAVRITISNLQRRKERLRSVKLFASSCAVKEFKLKYYLLPKPMLPPVQGRASRRHLADIRCFSKAPPETCAERIQLQPQRILKIKAGILTDFGQNTRHEPRGEQR